MDILSNTILNIKEALKTFSWTTLTISFVVLVITFVNAESPGFANPAIRILCGVVFVLSLLALLNLY